MAQFNLSVKSFLPLLVLCITFQGAFAQGPLFLSDRIFFFCNGEKFTERFFPTHDSVVRSVESSCLLNNVVYHKKENLYNQRVYSFVTSSNSSIRNPLYGYGATYTFNRYQALFKTDKERQFTFDTDARIHTVDFSGYYYFKKKLLLSLGLGENFSKPFKKNRFSYNPFKYLVKGSSSRYFISTKYQFSKGKILGKHSKYLSTAPFLTVTNLANNRDYQTGISLFNYSYTLDGALVLDKFSVGLKSSFKKIISDTLLQSDDPLSTKGEFNQRHYVLYSYFNTLDDSLYISYRRTGGYLDGYFHDFRYLNMKGVVIHNLSGKYGLTINKKSKITLFGEYNTLTAKKWDINFAPFSAWTTFFPMAWRFTNILLSVQEYGIHYDYRFTPHVKHQFRFSTGGSAIIFNRNLLQREKKIVVLLPIFTNEKLHSTDNQLLGLASFKVGYTYRPFNGMALKLFIDQVLPFGMKRTKHGGTVIEVKVLYGW